MARRRQKSLRLFVCIAGIAFVTACIWIINGVNRFSTDHESMIHPKLRNYKTLWKHHLNASSAIEINNRSSSGQNNKPVGRKSGRGDNPVIIDWFELGGNDEDISCNFLQCHVTRNREVLQQHDILGIVFYGTLFGQNGLPIPRKPGHLWSILHEESPKNNNYLFCAQDAMALFNLTGTFKRESHYPFPTMWLRDPSTLTSTEFIVPVQTKNQFRKEGLAAVVFVHSDCDTPSDRSHYLQLLQQHIHVDSYGVCEHNKDFPRNLSFTYMKSMAPMTSPDFYRFIARYKFAIAFENAVIDDYITEKFWRPLHLGVVPLVFGSSKIKDFAPSAHSIIDIRDFRSVKELADYITFLDTHDDDYSKYLDFKRTGITNPTLKSYLEHRDYGQGKQHSSMFSGFRCFVCEKLHKLKQQMISGQPVEQWLGKLDHYGCQKPKAFDERGRYVLNHKHWDKFYEYAQFYLQSLRYHIENNINANGTAVHKLASILRKRSRPKLMS